MVENLLDPAHLPFTHEGTLAKRKDAEEITFDIVYDNLFDKEKFEVPLIMNLPLLILLFSASVPANTRGLLWNSGQRQTTNKSYKTNSFVHIYGSLHCEA